MIKEVTNMFGTILGMLLLGGAVIAQMAEDDFDFDKMADRQMKRQDEEIERKFKEVDKMFKDNK
jgi:hypothetical protein